MTTDSGWETVYFMAPGDLAVKIKRGDFDPRFDERFFVLQWSAPDGVLTTRGTIAIVRMDVPSESIQKAVAHPKPGAPGQPDSGVNFNAIAGAVVRRGRNVSIYKHGEA
jgi:hypothetical protein